MAAYGALVSLMHIINQIKHHPLLSGFLPKIQVQSLTENVTFLQDFLESYSTNSGMESRIAGAAYAAEDVIESHIVGRIRASGSTSTHGHGHGSGENTSSIVVYLGKAFASLHGLLKSYYASNGDNEEAEGIIESRAGEDGSTSTRGEMIGSVELYEGLEKVIRDMDVIKIEVMEIKDKIAIQVDQTHHKSLSLGSSRSSRSSTGQNTMVGFDDVLMDIMDKLTGPQSNLQIIPIVGMGGIGKTTLARNIYANPLIKHHFDVLAWATISHDYSIQEICIEVICGGNKEGREKLSQMNEYELGNILHKSLWGRRYLIIMDDMWSIELWENIKFFFPDNTNGSRVIVTTRLSCLAFHLTGCRGIEIRFLDDERSWSLLCNHVFGDEAQCPPELEEIGKKLAKNCKGLPLSIVVIAGLLSKSHQHTPQYWEHICENLSSIVNLEDNEGCLKTLQLSYNQLPIHLKPCFLYMGVFREDSLIRFSWLIKLLVAEGFLKPIISKSQEVVAEEYITDLIDRNLIFVHKKGSNGKIKWCIIHDLLRDLSIREANKEKFLHVTSQDSGNSIPQAHRRIAIHKSATKQNFFSQVLHALQIAPLSRSQSLVRSIACDAHVFSPSHNFRLLRVLKESDKHFSLKPEPSYSEVEKTEPHLKTIFELVNLRFLATEVDCLQNYIISSSIHHLWNLETLVVNHSSLVTAPSEIWKMPQLKHVKFFLVRLPDPSGDFVLGNLETLLTVMNLKLDEGVVKRVPNIKKLRLIFMGNEGGPPYGLNNLGLLHKLESLGCCFHEAFDPLSQRRELLQNLTFPHSLKKLTLGGCSLHWEDMTTKIGALLPNLEVLKLFADSFVGPEWETVEGQFCSLKFLLICYVDLEYWTTDSAHFPRLEQLRLGYLSHLRAVPLCIGEIPTLESIQLDLCMDSCVVSAKKIVEEQEEVGDVGIQVKVVVDVMDEEMKSLACPNFQIQTLGMINYLQFPELWPFF